MTLMRTILLSFLLLAAGGVEAQDGGDRLELARASARAQVALAEDDNLKPYRLSTTIENGELVVRGSVPRETHRGRALDLVRQHWQGRRVRDEIRVDPTAERSTGPLPPRLRADTPPPQVAEAEAPPRAPEQEATPQQPQESSEEFHTVQSGDTLFDLARRYNTTVAEIQRLNNLRGTNLRLGQRLRVR